MTTLSRKYEIGEKMSNEDSLAHYGVLGMKWGKRRAKGDGYDIRTARANVLAGQNKLANQRRAVRKTKTDAQRTAAQAKYKDMKVKFLNNPDRVLASRLTRGEKAVVLVFGLGMGGASAIAGTSAVSRRIERKQETGAYNK